jgi:hypothetical protein
VNAVLYPGEAVERRKHTLTQGSERPEWSVAELVDGRSEFDCERCWCGASLARPRRRFERHLSATT